MTKQKGLMGRIGEAVDAARRAVNKGARAVQKTAHDAEIAVERKAKSVKAEVKSATGKAERDILSRAVAGSWPDPRRISARLAEVRDKLSGSLPSRPVDLSH